MPKRKMQPGVKSSDHILYTINYILLTLFLLIVAYPIIFIISASFSSPDAVSSGRVYLLPVKPCLDGYRAVFTHKLILSGYINTIIYTLLGTIISICITMIAAYALSRRNVPFSRFFMAFFVFTMFFNGGLIPTYILISQLHLVNTIWVMILPGAMSVYNMIIARTFIRSTIPNELLEASFMDGCSDFRYFFKIVLPLSKSVIAVITLFVVVWYWNSYFQALIYLNDPEKHPLQLILRQILISNKIAAYDMKDPELMEKKRGLSDLLKYSLIIVSSLPVLILYPFVQKYFVTGMMIGSVKG